MAINLASVALGGVFVLLATGMALKHWERLQMRSLAAKRRLERELRLLPMKLNALERLTLMLERLTPTALVLRINQGAMTGAKLQFELLKSIREEWELNMAMQMYVSPYAREALSEAKAELDKLLHESAKILPSTASGLELSQVVLQNEERTGMKALKNALQLLKKETQELLQN
jgi:hypothetical protein